MALRLSDDLWTAISDCLQSPIMRLVCRRLAALLQDRHLRRRLHEADAVQWLKSLQKYTGLGRARSLVLDLLGVHSGVLAMQLLEDVLRGADKLQTLRVCVRGCELGAEWCRPLRAAQTSRALQSLHLDIAWDNRVQAAGPGWLEPLRGTTALRTLYLSIPANGMGPHRVAELALLREIPQLRKLTVQGWGCPMEVTGAQSLAVLNASKHLHDLTLHLGGDQLGPVGTAALAALRAASQLCRLELDLSNNGVGAEGAQAVASLREAPQLRMLHLDLSLNQLGPEGALALAPLASAPQLRTLQLVLTGCEIGVEGARSLALLRRSAGLRSLALHLGDNQLGSAGAQALAVLHEAPALESLSLDMDENGIGDDGCAALAELRAARSLQHLELHLALNDISDEGGASLLFGLRGAQTLRKLTLNLEDNAVGPRTACAVAAWKQSNIMVDITLREEDVE